jgi:hypothetical protein
MVGKPKTCINRYLGGLGRGLVLFEDYYWFWFGFLVVVQNVCKIRSHFVSC